MKITWIGHACFAITADDGTVVVTDPYEPGGFGGALGYGPITVRPDIVTVSHEHEDHGYVQGLQGKPVVIREGAASEAKGMGFDLHKTFHDTARGAERGSNTIICFTIDGVRLCHLGDLGHELDNATAGELGDVDILFVPVGGFFTIDADAATRVVDTLKPRIVVPMHYKTDKCSFPISTVEPFLKGKSNIERTGSTEFEIDKGTLPPTSTIVVLDPAA
jgi:L-ascorbate metabolism protein UlaG (beta-lactamase superfamily)